MTDKIAFIDLAAQQAHLKPGIDAAIAEMETNGVSHYYALYSYVRKRRKVLQLTMTSCSKT